MGTQGVKKENVHLRSSPVKQQSPGGSGKVVKRGLPGISRLMVLNRLTAWEQMRVLYI